MKSLTIRQLYFALLYRYTIIVINNWLARKFSYEAGHKEKARSMKQFPYYTNIIQNLLMFCLIDTQYYAD